jgi:hypothetical protein
MCENNIYFFNSKFFFIGFKFLGFVMTQHGIRVRVCFGLQF